MSVTVLHHQHDPALVLEGTQGHQLMIQTGTLIIDFHGSPDGDWVRDRVTHPVLDLPAGAGVFGSGQPVRAIASAAPASINYSPIPGEGGGGGSGLVAQGNVVLLGSADPGGGGVSVGGFVVLPVVGGGQGSVPVPGAGWAVDRTAAVRSGNQIQLVADVAVAGPASVMRLAYSLFVTISPRNLVVELEHHHHFIEP